MAVIPTYEAETDGARWLRHPLTERLTPYRLALQSREAVISLDRAPDTPGHRVMEEEAVVLNRGPRAPGGHDASRRYVSTAIAPRPADRCADTTGAPACRDTKKPGLAARAWLGTEAPAPAGTWSEGSH